MRGKDTRDQVVTSGDTHDLVVFSGQGAQTPHMGKAFYRSLAEFREVYDEGAEVLGYDLVVAGEGGRESFQDPEVIQPLLVAYGIAAWAAIRAHADIRPMAFAGHSLGEVVALVAAGSLDVATALRFARERGRAMRTCPPGAMAAIIGSCADRVNEVCRTAGAGLVQIANINLPDQIVISGHREAVNQTCATLEAAGAIAKPLRISVAGHSELMEDAEGALKILVEDMKIGKPNVPVLSTLTGDVLEGVIGVRENLYKAMTRPVDWVAVMRAAESYDVNRILECGPRTVLRDFARELRPDVPSLAISDTDGLQLLGLRFSGADVRGSACRALRILAGTPRLDHSPRQRDFVRDVYKRLESIVDAPEGTEPDLVEKLMVEGLSAKGFSEAAITELALIGKW